VQSGLDGYLLRKIEPESLIQAIKLIHRGRSILDPELTRKALKALPKSIQTRAAAAPQLSKRELEVIELVASGMSNLEIAKHLHISVLTVKSHTTHIMTKLGTKNRVGSVMAALRYGLLGGDS
jgi:DNA-binding NarL/FixJ family response regulator